MEEARCAAFRYCRWLTVRAGSHFSFSFLLLSPERRRAMEAVYAFCRAMDDVVDREEAVPEEARRELDLWRRELDACEQGFPTHPIAVAITEAACRHSIPIDLFRKLITGVEMDLGHRRYSTYEELRLYCEQVASVVGLISVRVFGCRHPDSDRYATELGLALQLINILRDLKSDAEQGRVYLPAEELQGFGCSEEELRAGKPSGPLLRLMESHARKAWDHFGRASAALRSSGEGRRLLPARIMGGVYAQLLRRIQRAGYDVFSRRIRVSRPEQFWIAAKCFLSVHPEPVEG